MGIGVVCGGCDRLPEFVKCLLGGAIFFMRLRQMGHDDIAEIAICSGIGECIVWGIGGERSDGYFKDVFEIFGIHVIEPVFFHCQKYGMKIWMV